MPRARQTLTYAHHERNKKIPTDEDLTRIESYAAVLNIKQIASMLGLSEMGFWKWRQKYPELDEAIQRGKAKAIHGVGNVILDKALDGDFNSAQLFLKARAGWAEKSVVEEKRDLRVKIVLGDDEDEFHGGSEEQFDLDFEEDDD